MKKPTARKQTRTRGQIIAKGPNAYLIRYFVRRRADGTRQYASKVVQGNRKAAQQALTQALSELDSGDYIEPSKLTLAQYLENWLETSVRLRVQPRTLEDYRHRLRADVIALIGDRLLQQLSLRDIQGCYAKLAERRLSGRTVRYTHSILKTALRRAIVEGLLNRNPAEFAELPRQTRREMQCLNREEVAKFLTATGSDDWHALWCVLILGGLRPGEALGLKWTDVQGNQIQIQRALKKGERDTYFLGDTKTASSRRTLELSGSVIASLQAHRTRQAAAILKAGQRYQRNGLIFANSVGQPMDVAKVRRIFKQALKAAAVPDVRLYDLRHTHVTLLLGAGVNIKVISERVGHSNIEQTLSTYSHVLPHMRGESVERLDQFLAAAV